MRLPISSLPAKYQEQVGAQLHGKPVIAYRTTTCEVMPGGALENFAESTHLVLPYPPSANRYWRSIIIKGSVRVVVSSEAKAFKKAVSAALVGLSPVAGPVSLTMTFYRPRKRGDLDNLLKVTLDSMKGIAFHDDSQVERIEATRKEDKENPRVEIALRQL